MLLNKGFLNKAALSLISMYFVNEIACNKILRTHEVAEQFFDTDQTRRKSSAICVVACSAVVLTR